MIGLSAQYELNFNMKGSGFKVNERAGENLGNHKLVYRNAAGTWSLADADAVATMPVLGITMGEISSGKKGEILLWGYIGDNLTWAWTLAQPIYASTVAGELTQTMPAGIGDVVQVVAMPINDPTMIQFIGSVGAAVGGSNTLEGETAFVGFDPSKDHFVNYWYCDGTADNVQLQTAIDYCETLGKGAVFVESGTYEIVAGLVIQQDGVSLIGENMETTVLDPSSGLTCLTVGTSGVKTWYNEIRNLSFDGPSSVAGNIAILLYSPNGVVLDNLFMDDFYYGIQVISNTVNGTYNITENIKTLRVQISYEQGGTANNNGNVFNACKFSGWVAKPAGSIGINVLTGDTSRWMNSSIENYETGINLAGVGDGHSFLGMRLENIDDAVVVAGTVDDCRFIGGSASSITTLIADAGDDNAFFGFSDYYQYPRQEYYKTSDPDGNIGTHPAVVMPDGADTTIYDALLIPPGFNTLIEAVAIVVSGGTGDMRRSAASNWGESGVDDYNTSSDTIAAGQVAVTADKLEEINLSTLLTGVVANDVVGFTFTREGSNVNDTVNADCYYLGVRIQYV